MTTVSSVLLAHLDELLADEFHRFKWYLTEGKLQGINPIAKSKLENAKQTEVVSLMVKQYGSSDAGKIAVRILREIQQMNLADQLKKKLAEAQDQAEEVSSCVSTVAQAKVPAQAPGAKGVTQSISAGTSGSVKAPVISGSTFSGPVNMTFN
ncbi:caspase b-like [Hoplias malabaricus]|uniref:caspase b-like n=1 Tax=Hoplias malabaricus TaxID=27720 RepID=UPI0034625EDC